MGSKHGLYLLGAAVLAAGCVEETVSPEIEGPDPLMAVVDDAPFVGASSITQLPPLAGEESAQAVAVNAHGVVVGSSGGRAVMWQDGVPSELATLPGAESTGANSISEAGRVGLGVAIDGMTHLAIWEDGTVTEVPTLPGYTRTTGTVNDDGMVIATSCAASCFSETAPKRGFVWDDGQVTTLPPVPGDESSKASWGNGSGLVVGASENIYEEPDDPRDEWRFVVWQDGELIWVQGEGGDHLGINPGPTGNGA